MRIAKKDDWQNVPLPEAKKVLLYKREFTKEEMDLMQVGILPNQMEDKWFIYFDDNVLHFHRSWTGTEIFQLVFISVDSHYVVESAIVNREPTQYNQQDDDFDIKLLDYLIDRLLLSKRVAFPENITIEQDKQPLYRHSWVGYARSNQEE
jgi:hypothetical protein